MGWFQLHIVIDFRHSFGSLLPAVVRWLLLPFSRAFAFQLFEMLAITAMRVGNLVTWSTNEPVAHNKLRIAGIVSIEEFRAGLLGCCGPE